MKDYSHPLQCLEIKTPLAIFNPKWRHTVERMKMHLTKLDQPVT
ncbi:hypothetical protein [Candidatus Nitrotoga sp. BS]|nr:hypothetical protein [Candidatus Nitrotoga sp. BS]